MPLRDEVDLDDEEWSSIEFALAADPALRAELEAIVGFLGDEARRRFWSALAEELRSDPQRPAVAVLGALERAALD